MEISYSQVEAYGNEIHNLANRIKDDIEEIKKMNNSLVSSDTWNSEAGYHYQQKLKKVLDSYNSIYTELENSVLYMAKCTEGYKAIDNNVMKEICNNLDITEVNLSTSSIFR